MNYPIIMIVVTFVVARLLQVPLEHSKSPNKEWLLWTISLVALVCVAWFVLQIWGVREFELLRHWMRGNPTR